MFAITLVGNAAKTVASGAASAAGTLIKAPVNLVMAGSRLIRGQKNLPLPTRTPIGQRAPLSGMGTFVVGLEEMHKRLIKGDSEATLTLATMQSVDETGRKLLNQFDPDKLGRETFFVSEEDSKEADYFLVNAKTQISDKTLTALKMFTAYSALYKNGNIATDSSGAYKRYSEVLQQIFVESTTEADLTIGTPFGRRVGRLLMNKDLVDDKMFKQEATYLERLQDIPRVCKILDFDSEKQVFYVEHCNRGDLFIYVRMSGGKTSPFAAKLTLETLETMASIHGRGLAHGDLKPENWLVNEALNNENRSEPTLYLADLGTMRRVHTCEDERTCPSLKSKGEKNSTVMDKADEKSGPPTVKPEVSDNKADNEKLIQPWEAQKKMLEELAKVQTAAMKRHRRKHTEAILDLRKNSCPGEPAIVGGTICFFSPDRLLQYLNNSSAITLTSLEAIIHFLKTYKNAPFVDFAYAAERFNENIARWTTDSNIPTEMNDKEKDTHVKLVNLRKALDQLDWKIIYIDGPEKGGLIAFLSNQILRLTEVQMMKLLIDIDRKDAEGMRYCHKNIQAEIKKIKALFILKTHRLLQYLSAITLTSLEDDLFATGSIIHFLKTHKDAPFVDFAYAAERFNENIARWTTDSNIPRDMNDKEKDTHDKLENLRKALDQLDWKKIYIDNPEKGGLIAFLSNPILRLTEEKMMNLLIDIDRKDAEGMRYCHKNIQAEIKKIKALFILKTQEFQKHLPEILAEKAKIRTAKAAEAKRPLNIDETIDSVIDDTMSGLSTREVFIKYKAQLKAFAKEEAKNLSASAEKPEAKDNDVTSVEGRQSVATCFVDDETFEERLTRLASVPSIRSSSFHLPAEKPQVLLPTNPMALDAFFAYGNIPENIGKLVPLIATRILDLIQSLHGSEKPIGALSPTGITIGTQFNNNTGMLDCTLDFSGQTDPSYFSFSRNNVKDFSFEDDMWAFGMTLNTLIIGCRNSTLGEFRYLKFLIDEMIRNNSIDKDDHKAAIVGELTSVKDICDSFKKSANPGLKDWNLLITNTSKYLTKAIDSMLELSDANYALNSDAVAQLQEVSNLIDTIISKNLDNELREYEKFQISSMENGISTYIKPLIADLLRYDPKKRLTATKFIEKHGKLLERLNVDFNKPGSFRKIVTDKGDGKSP